MCSAVDSSVARSRRPWSPRSTYVTAIASVWITTLWLGLPAPTAAQLNTALPASLDGLDVVEHAGEQLPLDITFLDHRGQPVVLGSLFRGERPVILTMNYSNCPMLCNLQLTGLVEGLQPLEWEAGREFQVVSISIDPTETPERAALTQQRYLQMYGRPGTGIGWNFLVGKETAIRRIADSIGFPFRYVRERREYSHPAVFVICTSDGRISRYVYGVEFSPRTLQLSLVEAGEGTIGSAWDRVLLYCLHYDSVAGRYTPAAWKLMRAGGLLTMLCVGGLMLYYYRRERRQQLATAAGNTLEKSVSIPQLTGMAAP